MKQLGDIDWQMILEFVKTLTWPLVVVAGIIYFKKELRALINRISSVKIMGQEFATQQAKSAEETAIDASLEPIGHEGQLPSNLDSVQNDPEKLSAAQRAAARIWEYRYLNYFFAPDTQVVLDWLKNNMPQTTLEAYDAFWMNIIPHANERSAIIHALQKHSFITINGSNISLTDKGREYAGWAERRVLSRLLSGP